MEPRGVSRTERFSWEEQFWWKNTASDLRLLGTREEPWSPRNGSKGRGWGLWPQGHGWGEKGH